MDSKAIYQKANALVRQTGTRDAEKLQKKSVSGFIMSHPLMPCSVCTHSDGTIVSFF